MDPLPKYEICGGMVKDKKVGCGVSLKNADVMYTAKLLPGIAFCSQTCRATVTGEAIVKPEQQMRTLESVPAAEPTPKRGKAPKPPVAAKESKPKTPREPGAGRSKATMPWDDANATLHVNKKGKQRELNGIRGQVVAQFKEGIKVGDFLAKCDALGLETRGNLRVIIGHYEMWEVRQPK